MALNIHHEFRLDVYLDTQILAYLVDNTFSNLTHFVQQISRSEFVDVRCSQFAIYEFYGIRKLEHYLREIHNHSIARNGSMNFSSALKYKRGWKSPELDYAEAVGTIENSLNDDLKEIGEVFNISFDENSIHEGLWVPHRELVINSRISKEDALILLSSIYPDSDTKNEHVIFLTNDNDFYESIVGSSKMSQVDDVFIKNMLQLPHVSKIKNLTSPYDQSKLDLCQSTDEKDSIDKFINRFIIENIQRKLALIFLGYTIKCQAGSELAKNLLCFNLMPGKTLNKEVFISIISADLTHCHQFLTPLKDFFAGSQIVDYPFINNTDDPIKISVQINNVEGRVDIEEGLLMELNKKGNLVLIHPDSDLL